MCVDLRGGSAYLKVLLKADGQELLGHLAGCNSLFTPQLKLKIRPSTYHPPNYCFFSYNLKEINRENVPYRRAHTHRQTAWQFGKMDGATTAAVVVRLPTPKMASGLKRLQTRKPEFLLRISRGYVPTMGWMWDVFAGLVRCGTRCLWAWFLLGVDYFSKRTGAYCHMADSVDVSGVIDVWRFMFALDVDKVAPNGTLFGLKFFL